MYHSIEIGKRYALRLALRQIRSITILAVLPVAYWLTPPKNLSAFCLFAGISFLLLIAEFKRNKKMLALSSMTGFDWISILGTNVLFGGLAIVTDGLNGPLGCLILLPGILYYLEYGKKIFMVNLLLAAVMAVTEFYFNGYQSTGIRLQIMAFIIYLCAIAVLESFRKIIRHQDERVHYLLTRDELTGLYNRRFLKNKIIGIQKQRVPFALITLDINYFKYYNDHWGHSFGDVLLIQVGKVLKSAVGEGHYAARYSGDEFIVLLVSVIPEEVNVFAEEIIRRIEEESFPGEECFPNRKLTLSYGTVFSPNSSAHYQDLLREADQVLYQSKKLR